MPLLKQECRIVAKRMAPDHNGGWYWLYNGKSWSPIEVYPSIGDTTALYQNPLKVKEELLRVTHLPEGYMWG